MSGAPIVVRDINSIESVLQQAREELQRNEKSFWRNTERECAQLVNECVGELELYLKERGVRLPHMNANATESYLRGRYRQASLSPQRPSGGIATLDVAQRPRNNNANVRVDPNIPAMQHPQGRRRNANIGNLYGRDAQGVPVGQSGSAPYLVAEEVVTPIHTTAVTNTDIASNLIRTAEVVQPGVPAVSRIDSDSTPVLSPTKGIAALSSAESPPLLWVNRAIPAASQEIATIAPVTTTATGVVDSSVRIASGQPREGVNDVAVDEHAGRPSMPHSSTYSTPLPTPVMDKMNVPLQSSLVRGSSGGNNHINPSTLIRPIPALTGIPHVRSRMGLLGNTNEADVAHNDLLVTPRMMPAMTPMSDRSVYQSVAPSAPLRATTTSLSSPRQSTSAANSPGRSPQAAASLTMLHPVPRPVLTNAPCAAKAGLVTPARMLTSLPVQGNAMLRAQGTHRPLYNNNNNSVHADAHTQTGLTPEAKYTTHSAGGIALERIRMTARHSVPSTHHASPALRMAWLIEKHYGRPASDREDTHETAVQGQQVKEAVSATQTTPSRVKRDEEEGNGAVRDAEIRGIVSKDVGHTVREERTFHSAFRAQPRLQCFNKPPRTASLVDEIDGTGTLRSHHIHDVVGRREDDNREQPVATITHQSVGITPDIPSQLRQEPATLHQESTTNTTTTSPASSDTMQRSKTALATRMGALLSRGKAAMMQPHGEAVQRAEIHAGHDERATSVQHNPERATAIEQQVTTAHDALLRRAATSLSSLLAHSATLRAPSGQGANTKKSEGTAEAEEEPASPAGREQDASKTTGSATQMTEECAQKQRTAIYTEGESRD